MPTPFIDKEELIKEINKFVNSHNAYIANHSRRISDYFEMICYNNVIKYYKNNNFEISIQNLDEENNFVYKLVSTGIPANFSFFKVYRKYTKRLYKFEVHHNLSIESSIDNHIYFVPDISVINEGTIVSTKKQYRGKRRSCFCRNNNLQTFFEAKHLNAFPSLLFSFNGLVLEMLSEVILGHCSNRIPKHPSPTLVLSGNGNEHTNRIRVILMERYNINIIFGLFYRKNQLYSNTMKKIGSRFC